MLASPFDEPWDWDFFLALRQIECEAFLAAQSSGDQPDQPGRGHARLGTSRSLRDDPAIFGQFVSLAFAGSALEKSPENPPGSKAAADRPPGDAGRPPKLLVRFTGLTGPNGPLPLVLTEFIRNRLHGAAGPDEDRPEPGDCPAPRHVPGLAAFVDMFHHRVICLLYRAWAVASKAVDFDRHDDPDAERFFAEWIASTFGHGLPEFEGRDSIPTWQKLAFAGHLAAPTRPLDGLREVLSGALGLPCAVQALTGGYLDLPAGERCLLGSSDGTGTLGHTCVVGSRLWNRQGKFTVQLGPMSWPEFCSFQPGGSCRRLLHDWIDLYTRRELDWDATVILRREDAPELRLRPESTDASEPENEPGFGNRLGRSTWLLYDDPDARTPAGVCLADYGFNDQVPPAEEVF